MNVSSIAGVIARPFAGIYAASKHAVEAISEALHFELGLSGVRVHAVQPGQFPTELAANTVTAACRQAGVHLGVVKTERYRKLTSHHLQVTETGTIGADGIHSRVRRLAFGPDDRFLQRETPWTPFGDAILASRERSAWARPAP